MSKATKPRRLSISRTHAEIVGVVLGLTQGLFTPLVELPSPTLFHELDGLFDEHPFWFTLALVGCTGLFAVMAYCALYAVHTVQPWFRFLVKAGRQPLMSRYSRVSSRIVAALPWYCIGSAVGFGLAALLMIWGIYPTHPYSQMLLGVTSGLGAGLGSLNALNRLHSVKTVPADSS